MERVGRGVGKMATLGIVLLAVGLIGFVLTYMGVVVASGVVGQPALWAGVGAIGAVVAILSRRPRD